MNKEKLLGYPDGYKPSAQKKKVNYKKLAIILGIIALISISCLAYDKYEESRTLRETIRFNDGIGYATTFIINQVQNEGFIELPNPNKEEGTIILVEYVR